MPCPFPGSSPLLTWLLPEPCLLRGPGALGGAMGAGPVELLPGRSATILPEEKRKLSRYGPWGSTKIEQKQKLEPTECLGTLGPGVEVPLKLHLTVWLHGIHNHLEGSVQLEVDLMGQVSRTLTLENK